MVSVVRDICMFEGVGGCGVGGGWGVGRLGRLGRLLMDDFCVFIDVAAPVGRRLGRLGRLVACWWTTFVGVVRDVRV